MTNVSILKDGEVYSAAPAHTVYSKCISVLGIKACVSLKMKTDGLFLCVSVSSWEHCVQILSSGCATIRIPGVSIFQVKVCVTDFHDTATEICAHIKVTACADLWFTTLCTTVTNRNFCISKPHTMLKKIESLSQISHEQQLLLLQAFNPVETEDAPCACH